MFEALAVPAGQSKTQSKSSAKNLSSYNTSARGLPTPASVSFPDPPGNDGKPSKPNKLKTRGTSKLKSGADTEKGVKGINVKKGSEWKQPLRRHINPETNAVEYVTILVRILSGDAEHDFHARFPPTPLLARNVCGAIAEKEQLTTEESKLFSLWVVSKDLEIQIRPDQDIFRLIVCWNRWVMKYTHFPEAEDPSHHVNRHWFIYRREASVSLRLERELAGEIAVGLLYGEAKRNILTRRYVCSQLEAATIAGYQLQMAYGDFSIDRCSPGYLMKDERLNQLLPIGMADKMRPSQWEEIITVQYKSLLGLDTVQCRQGLLEFVRRMPSYGCSFFPVCTELPPSGFFEFRTQNWILGAGPNGICIIDTDVKKYVYNLNWKDIKFKAGPDQFFIYQSKGERIKEIKLISPQGMLIENMATRHKYSWAKETGKLKNKDIEQQPTILKSEEVGRENRKSFFPRKKSIAVTSRESESKDRPQPKRKGSIVSEQSSDHPRSNSGRKGSVSPVNPVSSPNRRTSSAGSSEHQQKKSSLPDDSNLVENKDPISQKADLKQKGKKEATLSIFIEEAAAEEEEKQPVMKKSGFLFSKQTSKVDLIGQQAKAKSKDNLIETLKGSKERIAGSLENLGNKLSKSVTKLLQKSDEKFLETSDKVPSQKITISTEEINFMVATSPVAVVQKVLPVSIDLPTAVGNPPATDNGAANISIASVAGVAATSADGNDTAVSTSASSRNEAITAKPAYKARLPATKRPVGITGSSTASLEIDLLSQLDDIASTTGIKKEIGNQTPKSISSVAAGSKLSQTVDETAPSKVESKGSLSATSNSHTSHVVKHEKTTAYGKEEEEEEAVIQKKTPPMTKKDPTDSNSMKPAILDTSFSPPPAQLQMKNKPTAAASGSPSSSVKSSPRQSRPVSTKPHSPSTSKTNSPTARKVSKFGKLTPQNSSGPGSGPVSGGSTTAKTYAVRKPSALSTSNNEPDVSISDHNIVQSPEVENEVDEGEDEDEPYEAPVNFTPTTRRPSQLPTGTLGTTIDISKVKQRQSKMVGNNSPSGIVRRSDDIFSLDEYMGGVAETELIDKRSRSKRGDHTFPDKGVCSIAFTSESQIAVSHIVSNVSFVNIEDSLTAADGRNRLSYQKEMHTRGDSVVRALISGLFFPIPGAQQSLVGGDDEGNLIMFLKSSQIFTTLQMFGNPISALAYQCIDRYPAVIAADESGVIASFNAFFDVEWRVNLARVSNRKESSIIKSIICENLLVTPSADAKPERQDFVIAIDQSSAIYFLRGRDGTHFKTVETNGEEMNCACSARGMDEDSLVSKTQIVIGSSNGNLSYIDDFKIKPLANVGFSIQVLQVFRSPNAPNEPDYILCGGHFAALRIYHQKHLVANFECQDWVADIAVFGSKIALATLDQKITCLELSPQQEDVGMD